MLALYRAGRQAEALDAYAGLRRTLIEELGLEPSPEVRALQEAILRPDEQLLPSGPLRRSALAPRRRGRAVVAAVVAGVAAVAAIALVLSGGHDNRIVPATAAEGSVAVVAADDGSVVDRVAVGATPSALAVADGHVWVVNANDQTVSEIDGHSRSVQTFGVGATPTDVAAGAGAVWVGAGARPRGEQTDGLVTASLARLDPDTHAPRATIPLPGGRPLVADTVADHVAAGREGVWAIGPDGRVLRVDPATNRVAAVVSGLRARALALADGSVWALADNGDVTRIRARTATIIGRGRVNATAVSSTAAGAGGAWVSAPDDGSVWRTEAGAGDAFVMHTIPVSQGTTDLAYGDGALWSVNPLRGTLARIFGGSVLTIAVGGYPRAVAVGAGAVWVATAGLGRTAPPVTGPGRAAASCDRSFFTGPEPPQRIVVSDLPLQGGLRLSSQQMADAIAYVLRRRGFRAGRFRVAYQSCDDAVAALALLARRLRRAPVYVLGDGDDEYGRVLAAQFERSARALGVPLAGRASWSARARSQVPLAARVARSRARAVFLGGRLDTGGPSVVRALRDQLGANVALLAPDGFTPLTVLIAQAGRAAATGTFVSLTGVADVAEFSPKGRSFARELRAALGIRRVEPSAIYAAQAMEVALDAIARSDGTRASVRRALFATDLPSGLIGRVRFDANGDVSHSPVTILRVAPGTRGGPEAPNAVVDQVLSVRADLP